MEGQTDVVGVSKAKDGISEVSRMKGWKTGEEVIGIQAGRGSWRTKPAWTHRTGWRDAVPA